MWPLPPARSSNCIARLACRARRRADARRRSSAGTNFRSSPPNVADAVMSIGGLIFDRAMAGWDVSVVVDGDSDRVH